MSNGGARWAVLAVLDTIFEAIGKALYHWWHLVEAWTIIPVVEGLMRLYVLTAKRRREIRLMRASSADSTLCSRKNLRLCGRATLQRWNGAWLTA